MNSTTLACCASTQYTPEDFLFFVQHEGDEESHGGLRGVLCESAADAQVFVEAGVPQAGVLLVDRVGSVRQLESEKDGKVWGSYAEVPLGELFPRRYG